VQPVPIGAFGRRARIYASPRGAPTARRATDALLLVVSAAGLAVLVALYPPGSIERALSRLLSTFSGWPHPIWVFLYDLLLAWAVALLLAIVLTRRIGLVLQALAAVAAAVGIALVAARLAVGEWPDVSDDGGFPVLRLAAAGALILTVSPHLVRGLQRLGRWTLVAGVLCSMLVHPALPNGSVAAFLVAAIAATGMRLVFGTSLGRPGLDDVALALRALGVSATELSAPHRQVSGVFVVDAAADGVPLHVKIYGRDAYDTQLLATVWRTLWYEDAGRPLGLGRTQAVEREALVTLLAARAGVATREVVVAGATPAGDALLVLRGAARPLSWLDEGDVDDAVLARFWQALERLRAANLVHRDVGPLSVGLVEGEPGFLDFGHAATTPTRDGMLTDSAQLLATTAATVGQERAVAAAIDALGKDEVRTLLPYLQPSAFGPGLRAALKTREVDADDLRAFTARAVGAEEPELAKLRRVTWASAGQATLLVLAVLALMRIVGDVDYAQLRDDLSHASWGWIVAAFVAAQLPRFTQAATTLGSIAADLRYGPVYVLQLASSYLNLALPSSIARMAVTIRFFQRQGQPSAAAVTAGAIESVAGSATQAVLVLTLVLFSAADVPLDLSAPSGGSLRLLLLLLAIVVAAVLIVVLVGRVRRAIVDRVREWWPQVKTSMTALRAPNKLALLIGGCLATEVLFAAALGMMVRGFGYDVPLNDLIVLNSGISLLSSLVPVPGGIGVVEFGLEVGLTSAGMSPSAALGAILLYRAATFYVPPVWGFFAFRWLQRNRYL